MDRFFISELRIEHVRHLKDIRIPLSSDKMKHLILTGKNGSGKTSVLDAIGYNLEGMVSDHFNWKRNITLVINYLGKLRDAFRNGELILAYYRADRIFQAEVSNHIEKVELQDRYFMTDTPRYQFVKYLVDLKVTEALARNNGKSEKADAIQQWFEQFTALLRKIFGDDSLELIFEEDTFSFSIREKNREPFDFNTLSSGFAAVLDIVLDMIIRMEKKTNRSFDFNIPGIVLVDEIETHLHIELQKSVLELLTTIFPNVQFIVSTHSPFILNSISDAVIYDLESNTLVENGLADIPYGGIVEGYFQSSEMSKILEE